MSEKMQIAPITCGPIDEVKTNNEPSLPSLLAPEITCRATVEGLGKVTSVNGVSYTTVDVFETHVSAPTNGGSDNKMRLKGSVLTWTSPHNNKAGDFIGYSPENGHVVIPRPLLQLSDEEVMMEIKTDTKER